ncbi:hypothetical protein Salat_0835500 [Sesamum alatum]|uniref:Myb/SANT-like domain-containing protein n=1 Tax=Sesamum alatum TaxID=300844 RepID=A0AAE1YJN1_9LAMI|nr:hypothetical protein Salat_0835500 [Sesamum alatum]
MAFQDGYYFQEKLFYSTKWSKAMEVTFVDSLVQHQQNGSFHRDRVNYHAVLCSIFDVNKEHVARHSYATGQNKLKKLKERHALFSWLLTVSGVFCNKVHQYVIADDVTWELIIKEHVLAKCYVNAYEDLYEKLCLLFGTDPPTYPCLAEEEEVDSIASFAVLPGWVDDYPPPPMNEIILANIGHLDDASIDSTSLWRFLEEYYASDDEEVESMVGIPGFGSRSNLASCPPAFSRAKLCVR